MRVIAGKYKGRQLAAFKADNIRPTTDRVKEVIFNMVQFYTEGARVLDLFSGTGNLAIEALSRGAESVLAIELSKRSLSVIEKNKQMIGIGDELKILQKDVIKFLHQAQEEYDLIFIDPPFTEKMADEVMQALEKSAVFHEDTVIFIESSKHEVMRDTYGPLVRKAQKDFGDKILSQFVVGA